MFGYGDVRDVHAQQPGGEAVAGPQLHMAAQRRGQFDADTVRAGTGAQCQFLRPGGQYAGQGECPAEPASPAGWDP